MISKIISFILENVRAVLIGAVVFALLGTGLFVRGCNYGENRMDEKWKVEFANAKSKEVHRDTALVPQPTKTGTFKVQPISDAAYQKKIDVAVKEAQDKARAEANSDIQALQLIVQEQAEALAASYEPKLIRIETPELGELVLRYFPLDSLANVYSYSPPPLKTITIFQEKLVLQPRSDLETAGYIVVGVGLGALIMVVAH